MRRALHARRAAGLLAVAGSLLLLLHFHDRFWWPPDEGNFAHVAERILDGEILQADVQDVHAGHINFVNAAAMQVFGRRLVSMRYPLAAIALLQAVIVYALLIPRGPWIAAIGSVSGTALGPIQFLNPTPHWYCLFLAFALACWLQRRPVGAPMRLEVAGLLVGTIFLFRQLTGVLVAMAVITFLLLETRTPEASAGSRPRRGLLAAGIIGTMAIGLLWYLARATEASGWILFGLGPLAVLVHAWRRVRISDLACLPLLGRLAVGAAIATAPLALYHTVHGSLHAWFSDAVLTAMDLPSLSFVRSTSYLAWEALAVRTVASGNWPAPLSGAFWVIAPLLSLGLGILLLRRLAHEDGATSPGPLPIVAVFYGLVSVHYAIPIYLFYSLGISVIALLWVTAAPGAASRPTVIAAGALLLSSAAVFFQAGQPVTRGARGIIDGVREAAVSKTSLRRSGLRVDPRSGAVYETLVQLIERETRPNETIAAIPSNAELYFLAERRNPFRFYNTALGIRDAADLAAVLEVFRRAPPRLVLFEPTDKYNTPQSREIMTLVRTQYESLGDIAAFEIYRLGRPGGTSP
jgi:hypothetical protein